MEALVKLKTGECVSYNGVERLEYRGSQLVLKLKTDYTIKRGAELRRKYNASCTPFVHMYYEAEILTIKE